MNPPVNGNIPAGLPALDPQRAGDLYRAVVDAAPNPVILIDALGAVIGLNAAATQTLGLTRAQAMGNDLAELLTRPARRDRQLEPLRGLYRRPGVYRESEFLVRDAEDREVPMAVTATRLDGSPLGWTAVHLRDLRWQRKAEADLLHRALHDGLTGLPGRELFMDRLRKALAGRRGGSGLVGVLFLDLDSFKAINDGYGHAAGDAVLRHVADRAADVIRPEDTLARMSGDEFTVLCEDLAGEDEAVLVAGRVQEAIEQPFEWEGNVITPGVSIGAAVAGPGAASPEALLTQADAAMYASKGSSRDRPVAFDDDMEDRMARRTRTEMELRAAVQRGDLELRFQPQVALADGTVTGVEALVRWRHPTQGLLGPKDFVPLAEESGLIVELGRTVLDQALRQAHEWDANPAMESPPVVAVNLSPAEFEDPALARSVEEALERWGVDPQSLCLEITERTAMSDAGATLATLSQLGGMGVRLAIDDFGTGYSSLSYLRLLPVDQLKVDASFVEGLPRRRDDRAIVGAVVEMAHALDMDVVAEGIEGDAHRAELEKLHCDLGQGFLFAAPLTAGELDDYMAAQGRAAEAPPSARAQAARRGAAAGTASRV